MHGAKVKIVLDSIYRENQIKFNFRNIFIPKILPFMR